MIKVRRKQKIEWLDDIDEEAVRFEDSTAVVTFLQRHGCTVDSVSVSGNVVVFDGHRRIVRGQWLIIAVGYGVSAVVSDEIFKGRYEEVE